MTNGPENLWQAFRRMAPSHQITVLVVALVAVVALCSGVGAVVSKIKDARFDRAEAARAEERRVLSAERDAWVKRAEKAEAAAAVYEEQAAALRAVAATAGQTAREKAAEADKIQRETDAAVAAVGDLPPDAAREDIRARLRRLGY